MRGFGFSTVALVLLGVWALTGFYIVDAAERGVVTRFGQYVATTAPGLRWHIPWPIEARQIIMLHGGSVQIESRPGLGSTIRIKLPAR